MLKGLGKVVLGDNFKLKVVPLAFYSSDSVLTYGLKWQVLSQSPCHDNTCHEIFPPIFRNLIHAKIAVVGSCRDIVYIAMVLALLSLVCFPSMDCNAAHDCKDTFSGSYCSLSPGFGHLSKGQGLDKRSSNARLSVKHTTSTDIPDVPRRASLKE